MYICKMAYNFQLKYNYTTKIRQICSGAIFVNIVSISYYFIRQFVSKLGICMPDSHKGCRVKTTKLTV